MSTAKDGVIITLVTEKVDEVVAKLGARGLASRKSLCLTLPLIFTMLFSRPEWSPRRSPAIRRSSVAQASFEALTLETLSKSLNSSNQNLFG